MTFAPTLVTRASALLDAFRARGKMLATAESCTGGLLAGLITHVAGSSDVLERGFVTYTNRAKTEMIDVPAPLIEKLGAVSEEVARAMALGALKHSGADIAVSITGVAGPAGGTAEKPVGLVHFGAALRDNGAIHERHVFSGDRESIRIASLETAMGLAMRMLEER